VSRVRPDVSAHDKIGEKLGLRLQRIRAPVEVLVIDHIERSTGT
jgi:uncharacterized protein (TIGR03435 family)